MWTPQHKWQQRTGWQQAPLTVRGRAVRLLVRGEGPCRRVGWGERVFLLIIVRGHRKRTQQGKSRRLWGGGVDGDEVPKNGGVGWCWDVDVVLRWLCAFRL